MRGYNQPVREDSSVLFKQLQDTMSSNTRRNGGNVKPAGNETTKSTTNQPFGPPKPHRQRPNPNLLLIFPFILVLGSFYSTISPAARSTRTNALAPGEVASLNAPATSFPVNYFAGKRNLFNLYFVKIGWFWTTLAFVLLQATTTPVQKNPRSPSKALVFIRATARYALITLTWYFTAQWFFGPALIDRGFTWSGGKCETLPAELSAKGGQDIQMIATSIACKTVGGRWRGGHDISGHVFMLVLSSAFLYYELYLSEQHSSHPSVSPSAAAGVAHGLTDEEKKAIGGWESETFALIRLYSRYFVYAVIALDIFMLFMTAIWFHTLQEKISGLVIAAASVWCVYFLTRFAPVWKDIIEGV